MKETVQNSEFLFISVPTPASNDGSIDLGPLDACLDSISQVDGSHKPIILIRSTVIPGSTSKFQSKYQNLRLVFNPEFLTERNALFDFYLNKVHIGGEDQDTSPVVDLLKARFGNTVSIIVNQL